MKKNFDPTAAIIPALNAVGTNPTEDEDEFKNHVHYPEEIRMERKQKQLEKEELFKKYTEDLENQIHDIEEADIKMKMIMDRRDWIDKYKSLKNGEPPQKLDLYYDQFKVTLKEELDDNQKKESDKIAKDKLKKEQDKKKKGEDDEDAKDSKSKSKKKLKTIKKD